MKAKRGRLVEVLMIFMVLIVALSISGCAKDKRLVKEGRYLKADNGIHFLIDGELPIQMYNREIGEAMFDGLEIGDLIQVVHDPIRETYPAQTTVYSCVRLERGSWSDIPDAVIKDLTERGALTGRGIDTGKQ